LERELKTVSSILPPRQRPKVGRNLPRNKKPNISG
jgi:hypothetical protein